MYEHPFTIKEVAWLLSIRCLDGGTAQEFRWNVHTVVTPEENAVFVSVKMEK